MPQYDAVEKDAYYSAFAPARSRKPQPPLQEALRIALDTRQFEISLYWTRSAYFWAFVSVGLAGFFALESETSNPAPAWMPAVIALLLLVFSAAWYVVARASKFWQENWELHVDYLADKVGGPLFQTVANPANRSWWKPLDGLAVSVSRVNMILSLAVTIVSDGLLWYATNQWLKPTSPRDAVSVAVGALALLIGVLALFVHGARSHIDLAKDLRKGKAARTDFVRRRL